MNMSRGLHGDTANPDCNGAIAMYFSVHGLTGPTIVAITETFPMQSIVSRFWLQYSLTSRSVFEAATPTGSGTMAKGLGLAALSAAMTNKKNTTTAALRMMSPPSLLFVFIGHLQLS
jgi:hypothetical protein